MQKYNPILIPSHKFHQKIKESNNILLFEFMNPNDGLCLIMSPVLKKSLEKSTVKFEYYRVDVRESEEICNLYHIYSVPQYLIFYKSLLYERIEGVKPLIELLHDFSIVIDKIKELNKN